MSHFGADPLDAGRGSFDQPPMRSLSQGQERRFLFGAGPRFRWFGSVPRPVMRLMSVDDAGIPRCGQRMAGDLTQTRRAAADDDQFVADHPAPHPSALIPVRGRVTHRTEPDRLIIVDAALLDP